MPTYEYECPKCGKSFEQYQPITDEPLKRCPSCKSTRLKRLMGKGAGIIFKGSGFYQTDYRSESYKKGKKSETAVATPEKTAKPTESAPKKKD